MTKTELENKHIAELHSMAAAAGIERYRMLPRAELIAKLADGDSAPSRQADPERWPRAARSPAAPAPPFRRQSRLRPRGAPLGFRPRAPRPAPARACIRTQACAARTAASRCRRRAQRARVPPPTPPPPSLRPPRQEGVTLQGLLLPPEAGRQALLCAETREACTALLRGIAADLSGDSKGPDPVALLIDPSPEELADWRREAPQAEIVAAGQPRHASDALAQASARASAGDDVILLVDSLTRLGEAYEDADAAKEFFDAGRAATGGGTLTVVAALERPAQS